MTDATAKPPTQNRASRNQVSPTNLGLSHPRPTGRRQAADKAAFGRTPRSSRFPAILPHTPSRPHATTNLANRPPRAHGPLRSLPAMSAFPATDEPRTHLGHLPSSPADDLRALDPLRSLPAMSTFPATDEARTNLGRSPSSPTDGLLAHHPLRSSSAMAAFTQPMEPGHTSGARPPLVHHRRVTDHRCPLLPSLPLPANLTLLFQQDAPLPS